MQSLFKSIEEQIIECIYWRKNLRNNIVEHKKVKVFIDTLNVNYNFNYQ